MGSSVVELVLGGQKQNSAGKRPAGQPASYNDFKFGLACEFCNKAFTDQAHLDEHIQCKHPNLTKRIEAFKAALGLNDSNDEPDTKRIKLDCHQEVHKRETDELTNNNNNLINNNINNNNNNNVKTELMEKSKEDEEEVEPENLTQEKLKTVVDQEETKKAQDEAEAEDAEEEYEPKDRTDDVRFEAIQEEFEFDGKIIKPSYCVLPFVTDEEVEACTKRNIAEYYEQPEDYSEDEEGQMVIDEGPLTPENLILAHRNSPPAPVNLSKNNFNNNELKINSFGQGFANAINICRKEELTEEAAAPRPTHTVKFEPLHPALYYPAAFPDFSLPFSLSGLIQKKKAEMAAILAPRLSPKEEQRQHAKLTLDHLAKAAMVSKSALSPAKSESGGNNNNNTAVSEYENQIQNDLR